MSNNERALTPYQPSGEIALTTMDDLMKLGDLLFKSGMFSDVKSQAQAVVKILAGREVGIPPMEAMTKIDIVQGKIRWSADLMARLIKRDAERGGYDYRVARLDNDACHIQFYHKDQPLEPVSVYTMQDAAKAKLAGKDIYQAHPRNMLFARALTNGAKWHCPHLFGAASSVQGTNTDLEDDGDVVISAPTPPTEAEVVAAVEDRGKHTAPPRAASPRYHTQRETVQAPPPTEAEYEVIREDAESEGEPPEVEGTDELVAAWLRGVEAQEAFRLEDHTTAVLDMGNALEQQGIPMARARELCVRLAVLAGQKLDRKKAFDPEKGIDHRIIAAVRDAQPETVAMLREWMAEGANG